VWYRERTMEVTQVPIDDSSWTEFVSAHPAATAFHLPAWASLIADCYGYEAFALSVRDDSSELIAGLPVIAVRSPLGARRWVSLPFTDHCPMLVRDGVERAMPPNSKCVARWRRVQTCTRLTTAIVTSSGSRTTRAD
jgi:hypothetical protein